MPSGDPDHDAGHDLSSSEDRRLGMSIWGVIPHGSDMLIGAYWERGIATEAAKAVVLFGFESLGLPVLTSGYFEDNPASEHVLHKLGFVEAGRAMRSCLAMGGEMLSARMELPRPA